MLTFAPKEYKPFKKRIVIAILGSLLMPVIMPIIAYRSYTLIYNIEFGAVLSLFIVFPIGMYYAIYSLSSILIDEKRKTIHIQIRKFDKIIDKGEYPIDNNLKAEIIKKTTNGRDYIRLQLKYNDSMIYPKNVTADGWNKQMFVDICDEVENIKKTSL